MNLENFVNTNVYFIIYGFLGWIVEVIYVSFYTHKLENRGFLYGPFLPIYAFGAIFILKLIEPIKYSIILVFIFGVLISTILEYVSAYLLENIFKLKWWDYSSFKFNFQGRVCLRNSLGFGILTLVIVFLIQPLIIKLVDHIPFIIKLGINDLFFLIVIIDLYFTLKKLNKIPFRDIELLNIKFKNIEKFLVNYDKKDAKFKNRVIPKNFSLIITTSIVGLFIIIYIFNIYIGVLVTSIVYFYFYITNKIK